MFFNHCQLLSFILLFPAFHCTKEFVARCNWDETVTDVLVDTVMKCSAESCYLLLEVGDTKDEQAAVGSEGCLRCR